MTFSVFRPHEASARLPRGMQVRRAREEDEAATFDVMRKAMGYDMNWTHHAPTRRHLRNAPDSSFWLVEETARFSRPRIVGYAHSIVREGVWNLTEFFVLPTHHRQGLGRELLARCVEDGDRAGADTRLVLASHHPSADALYMRRAGCFPRLPMCLLSGPVANLRPPHPARYLIKDACVPLTALPTLGRMGREAAAALELTAAPIALNAALQQRLDALDREIVGYARPTEHALWTELMGGEMGAARLFQRQDTGEIVGYAYFGPHCSGPALAVHSDMLPYLLAHVAQVEQYHARHTQGFDLFEAPEPYWAAAGSNEVTLRWLLDCGWQIVFQYLFMSTRPFGQLDRYVCHNPLYML